MGPRFSDLRAPFAQPVASYSRSAAASTGLVTAQLRAQESLTNSQQALSASERHDYPGRQLTEAHSIAHARYNVLHHKLGEFD